MSPGRSLPDEGGAGDWPSGERLADLSALVRDITVRVAESLPTKLDALQLDYLRLVSLMRWSDQAVGRYESARASLDRAQTDEGRAAADAFHGCLVDLCRGLRFARLLGEAAGDWEGYEAPREPVPRRIAELCAHMKRLGEEPLPELMPDGLSLAGEFLSFDDLAEGLRWLDTAVERLLKTMMGISRAD